MAHTINAWALANRKGMVIHIDSCFYQCCFGKFKLLLKIHQISTKSANFDIENVSTSYRISDGPVIQKNGNALCTQ